MSRLGDTIKAARLKAGLSQKQLGKKCGVAESFITDVEMGTRIVSDDQAQRILKVLGVKNPISTELEVAAEPERALRPRPRPYVLPVEPQEKKEEKPEEGEKASNDAWLDALGGVVKRVPIIDRAGVVIDHRLLPVIGGKIEGGQPDKVLFYRMEDNSLHGFRIHAGDLLLTIPASIPIDDAVMLMQLDGVRTVRKVKKMEGGKLLLQTYEREFASQTVEVKSVLILGHCVRLETKL